MPQHEEENVAKKRDTGKKAYLVVLTLLFFLASSTIACVKNIAASYDCRVRSDDRVPAERLKHIVIGGEYEN